MHFRRLACFIAGAWLMGSIFMFTVATQNFKSVDRLLAAPAAPAAAHVQSMGHEAARMFLRYQISEQNRWYFSAWEQTQLALGVLLVIVLLFDAGPSTGNLIMAGLMVSAVAIEHWFMSPHIIHLGRAIDFVAADAASAERTQFWNYHQAYSYSEVGKVLLGAVLGGKLVKRSRRSGRSGREVDVVNEANHRHVDR